MHVHTLVTDQQCGQCRLDRREGVTAEHRHQIVEFDDDLLERFESLPRAVGENIPLAPLHIQFQHHVGAARVPVAFEQCGQGLEERGRESARDAETAVVEPRVIFGEPVNRVVEEEDIDPRPATSSSQETSPAMPKLYAAPI